VAKQKLNLFQFAPTSVAEAVAAYVRRPGDSTWRALALDVLRIEDGLITEIVVFPPDSFPAFRLPMMMDAPPEMNKCH
jgi:hypothetical protein